MIYLRRISLSVFNIKRFAIELLKERISNTMMYDIFSTRVLNYNLRSQADFFRNNVNTTKFGLNLLRYFAYFEMLKK